MSAELQTVLRNIPDGRYVVAVSGGVDSMVLLDLLALDPRQAEGRLRLIVAHFDHGIRPDSALDRQLVGEAAKRYGLRFVYDNGRLGAGASEASARTARYAFLHTLRQAADARAIILAHHQDDVVETAIINMLRGTHRRGLSALRSTDVLLRPFLDVTKQQLYDYARANNLQWREDETNTDQRYLRNRVRQTIVPRMTADQRVRLLQLIDKSAEIGRTLDEQLAAISDRLFDDQDQLDRHAFQQLPEAVAMELVAAWFRRHDVRGYDTAALKRTVQGAQSLATGKRVDVLSGAYVQINRHHVVLHVGVAP
ncbi:tRNA lysidine(34) synthetase TilS [Candidatus Saccharibacteria bacterium]|nr:MAG: tRNA lysidine(34) synthetase TilS [Candidatus Saccharibacteria bacterium]